MDLSMLERGREGVFDIKEILIKGLLVRGLLILGMIGLLVRGMLVRGVLGCEIILILGVDSIFEVPTEFSLRFLPEFSF